MTELPPLLTAGNARAVVTTLLAGCPAAKFEIFERPGKVDVLVAGATPDALGHVQTRLQAIAHMHVCIQVRAQPDA